MAHALDRLRALKIQLHRAITVPSVEEF